MGASQFETFSEGSDVETAFRDGVRHAQWEHGHGGYTGTLAEKEDYVVISSTPMTMEEAEEKAESLLRKSDPRIDNKWAPAGAIRVVDSVTVVNHYTKEETTTDYDGWLFFGWASD